MKAKKRVERLIPRLPELYKAHRELEEQIGVPPSVREVVKKLDLGTNFISRVHGDMETLVELGLAKRLPIPTRRYQCIGGPADKINWEELLSR